MTINEGRFPRSGEGILLCREAFPTLSVGDQVSFYIEDAETGKPLERSCTVSGFYRSDADRPPPAVALYGEDVAEGLDLSVMVNFHSSFGIDQRLDAVMERLSKWEILGEEQRTQINNAYAAADLGSFFQPDNVLLMLLAIGVLFFAAFLLIYNIYSIALLSAGLTLLTLFFSALRPLKKIRKMSPVQSVSGTQESAAPKKKKRREAPVTPGRLALAGLSRSRGRMLVTSLSAGLSVLLFVMVGGLTDVIVEGTVDSFGLYDVELTLSSPLMNGIVPPEYTSASKFAAVEPETIEILAGPRPCVI